VSAGEAAFEFLRSSDGRSMVVRALQRRGLPLGLHDDLVSEILHRVVTAEAREPIDNPAAFATHAAQYAAGDLLRNELRRPAPLLPRGTEDDDLTFDPSAMDKVDEDVIARGLLRDVRNALFDVAVAMPQRAATALAYLSAGVDDAPVGQQCPQPMGGAGAQEAAEWAGLWYGGRRDCFPGDGVTDGPNVRKRRSRAVGQLHETLMTAANRAQLDDA
jgi:hypothetical protein